MGELTANKKLLSLVVSAYNEEEVIELFYDEFLKLKADFNAWDMELIFVNDGSSDSTFIRLKKIASGDRCVRVLSFSKNFGHEAAMLAGIDNASGDAVICMDSDLQHPLKCIPEIAAKFDEGYDVVNMIRTKNKSVSRFKNFTSKLFYKVVNKLSGQSFKENASDFFGINKKVVKVLRENYREKNRFLRGYIQFMGFNSTSIDYEAEARAGGKSHYSYRKLTRFAVNTIVYFSDLPLKLGIYTGLFSGLLGLGVLIYTLVTREGAPSGYATIVVLICFLFAILFVLLGIIGQYISILFSEIKDRPIYIIDEKINFDDEA